MDMSNASRRKFLGLGLGAAAAVAVAQSVAADPASAATATTTAAGSSTTAGPIRFASDFGAVGDGRTDDTASIQAAIAWAGDRSAMVAFAPGIYAVSSLTVSRQVRLVGLGAGMTRYSKSGHVGGVVIVPVDPAATGPLVTIDAAGTGVELKDIVLDGYNPITNSKSSVDVTAWPARTGLEVAGGIEVRLKSVRVFRFRGTGIHVTQLNNSRWSDVFVDNCGSATLPAFVLSSPASGVSNFLDFDGLTIERSGNTALAIAAGTSATTDFVSSVTFTGLHIEANTDSVVSVLNTRPLVDLGNVRDVTFVAPHLLGAPVPLIDYYQRSAVNTTRAGDPGGDAGDQLGGVRILGGQLQQHGGGDPALRVGTIRARGNGRFLSVVGVKFSSLVSPGVVLDPTFQFDAFVDGCSFRGGGGAAQPTVVDRRPAVAAAYTPRSVFGDTVVEGGRLRTRPGAGRPATTLTTAASAKAAWVDQATPGTDLAGSARVTVQRGSTTTLATVRFGATYRAAPVVTLTPQNAATATAGLYVVPAKDGSGFTVRSTRSLGASAGALAFGYLVVGLG